MPLNPDAVGTESAPVEFSWTSKDALLYAVSIGAGTGELAFTTENTEGVPHRAFPTFGVVLGGSGGLTEVIGTFNRAMLVHGALGLTLHREIPVEGTGVARSRLTDMFDKGKAAVVVTETSVELNGRPLFTKRSSSFIRGEGGWGGDRGPTGPQHVPPDIKPDHEVTYQTSPDQALLYRLNRDRNRMHSDPSFAATGGFDRPILHGLCTYGFTGRALLHTLCDSDPARFRHVEGRFASPVFPGEPLTVRVWRTPDSHAVFTTSVADRLVIDQGLVKYEQCFV